MGLKPGYKQTEVGAIPEGWTTEGLGPHVEIKSGESPSLFRFERDGVPYFKVDQLNNDNKYLSATPYFFRGEKTVPQGSLIFAKRGASILLNKVRILARDAFMDTNLMTLTPKSTLDSEYLYYALSHIQLWRIADTTSIPQINNKHIIPLIIPIPPLPEQRAIAAALSDVDALISALDKLIAKKRDLKQAAMQQLLTGKQRLPGFGGAWERKTIAQIAPLQRGFDLPTWRIKPGTVPVVYSNGVLNYHAEYMAKGPGVVTGRSGTIGKVNYVEQDYWPHNTTLWITSFKGNHPKFIFYLYTAIGFERFGTGSGVPTLNRNDVHSFEVEFPNDPAEQTAIATVLSDMDTELAALEQKRDKTRLLKQGMMQELLTGKTRLVAKPPSHE